MDSLSALSSLLIPSTGPVGSLWLCSQMYRLALSLVVSDSIWSHDSETWLSQQIRQGILGKNVDSWALLQAS